MRDRSELLESIEADTHLSRLLRTVGAQLTDASPVAEAADPGHDIAHSLRVALWAVRLGGEHVDQREAVAAALLHDLVNLPKDSPERAEASVRSAEVAANLLPEHGFDEAATARVCAAIRDHSYSRGAVPATPLGRALSDADRLEALGALGVFRTATCGARMGAAYLHPEDPWAQGRALDDAAFTLDHFFVKLLRLEQTLHTEAGRAEARRRSDFMRRFLRQLGEEIGEPPPDGKL